MTTTVLAQIVNIPVTKIFADPEFNCRGAIIPRDVIELARDISENGLQSPVIVRPQGEGYSLVAGFRRFTAMAKVNKQETVPCIIREDLDELGARRINLTENLLRKDLNILQEAKALTPFVKHGFRPGEIARELQQSVTWVDIRMKLLELSDDIQEQAAAGLLTQEQIRIVYNLPESQRHSVVKEIKEKKLRKEKISIPGLKPPVSPLARKKRKPEEVEEMIDTMCNVGGMGLHTRCLAWCAGNISTYELLKDFKQHCDDNGIPYGIPPEITQSINS